MPGDDRFLTGGIHLAISKALAHVNIGAAGLKVLAFDLWRSAGGRRGRLSAKRGNRKGQG
jgi:hypothetical protein